MTDMVERIGEAALKGLLGRRGVGNELESYKYEDPDIWAEIVTETGKAAIEAMMEPSEEMTRIGRDKIDARMVDPLPHSILQCAAQDSFAAMIKAALEEE